MPKNKDIYIDDSLKYNDLNARNVLKIGDRHIPMYARLLIRKN